MLFAFERFPKCKEQLANQSSIFAEANLFQEFFKNSYYTIFPSNSLTTHKHYFDKILLPKILNCFLYLGFSSPNVSSSISTTFLEYILKHFHIYWLLYIIFLSVPILLHKEGVFVHTFFLHFYCFFTKSNSLFYISSITIQL